MAATSGYQAGIETNVVDLSYLAESTWGSLDSGQFQAIRFTSETLKRTKTRQRPGEVPVNREAPAALTCRASGPPQAKCVPERIAQRSVMETQSRQGRRSRPPSAR